MVKQPQNAVVLLSGGLDSATVLAIARERGFQNYALSFDYGQRSQTELQAAAEIARTQGVLEHKIFKLDMAVFGGSALTDPCVQVPRHPTDNIPVTYVPARNTVFLSLALAWAETVAAHHIFIGVNAVDYSGYPDCRPEYIAAFEALSNLATRDGVEGRTFSICAPLIELSKAQIIVQGMRLGVDYAATVSCYQADSVGRACGVCDSCRLRAQGFLAAGTTDPTRYQSGRSGVTRY